MQIESMVLKDIKLEDSVILASDKEGNDLLRFRIQFGDFYFLFKPPSYRKHLQLIISHAKIIAKIASIFPQMLVPDLELLEKEGSWFDWAKLSEKAFMSLEIISMIEDAVFELMDIEHTEVPKDGYKVPIFTRARGFFDRQYLQNFHNLCRFRYIRNKFEESAKIVDIQKLFTFLCLLNETIKKNGEFLLRNVYRIQKQTMEKPESSSGSGNHMGTIVDMFMMPPP